MTDILLTNDDGYKSIGFYPLLCELSKNFNVVAVAPTSQRSWQGKSISSRRELKIEKIRLEGKEVYVIDGTPADCVQIGLYDLVEKKPRFVVSGINIGVNIGHGRILSSGTAGAGMEAVIDGVKAVSSSLYIPSGVEKEIDLYDPKYYYIYQNAAEITAKIIKILYGKQLEEDIDLVSINVLNTATAKDDFEITSLDRTPYGRLFHRTGDTFTHSNPKVNLMSGEKGTDTNALRNHKISITPISLELTSKNSKNSLNNILRNEW